MGTVVIPAQTWELASQKWIQMCREWSDQAQSRKKKAQKTFDGVQKKSPATNC
jgi:hypothetical protein